MSDDPFRVFDADAPAYEPRPDPERAGLPHGVRLRGYNGEAPWIPLYEGPGGTATMYPGGTWVVYRDGETVGRFESRDEALLYLAQAPVELGAVETDRGAA